MKLSKNHPFYIQASKAEKLEQQAGKVTGEVLAIRKKLKQDYPKIFEAYIKAKKEKQEKQVLEVKSKKAESKRKSLARRKSILYWRRRGKHFGDDQ